MDGLRITAALTASLALLLATRSGTAAEIGWLDVERDDKRFNIRAQITIDAPVPAVFEALLAYDRFAELSERFTESHYVEPDIDGAPRIFTRIEGCIWFFCRKVDRYARLDTAPYTTIVATTEADKSDADYSVESWTLTNDGESTLIDYRHELETGFWVPPLIGKWIIRRALTSGVQDAAERIERLALGELGGSPPEAASAAP